MTRLTRSGPKVLPLAAAVALLLTGPTKIAATAALAAGSAPAAGPPGDAAASASKSTPPAKPAPQPPTNLEALTGRDCTGVLGKKVIGPDGKELGLVVDVLVDVEGQPHAAIIDFGGFLGVGSRKIAVDWRLLKPVPGQPDWKLPLNLDRAEIQGAPEYKPDAASNKMVGPLTASPLPDAAR